MTEISNIIDVRPVVPNNEYNSIADIVDIDSIRTTKHGCRGYIETIVFDVFSTEGSCTVQLEALIHTHTMNEPNTFSPRIYMQIINNQNNIIHPAVIETLSDDHPLNGREHEDPDDAQKELYKILYGMSRNLHNILQHDQ